MRPGVPDWNPEKERQALLEAEEERVALPLDEKHQRISQATDLVRQAFEKIFTIRAGEMKFPGLLPELQKRGWDKPTLAFHENDEALRWLHAHDFDFDRPEDCPDAIVVFQLPLPIARFWWKSKPSNLKNPLFDIARGDDVNYNDPELAQWNSKRGVYWPETEQSPGVEEWGEMYWRKMQESFAFLDQVRQWRELEDPTAKEVFDLLKPAGGWGERLNDLGYHDAKAWYYVWGWWLKNQSK